MNKLLEKKINILQIKKQKELLKIKSLQVEIINYDKQLASLYQLKKEEENLSKKLEDLATKINNLS